MEKASCTVSVSSQVFAAMPSPRLVRSRSGSTPAAAITTPERISSLRRFTTSERFTNNGQHRSKSTSRCSTRTPNHHNPQSPPNTTIFQENNDRKKKKSSSGDRFRKFLSRGVSPDNDAAAASSSRGRATTGMKGPSAWALSPGRISLGPPIPVWYESSTTAVKHSGGGRGVTNKVLKYFTQRKVSGMEEEQYYRFRILHNRLLQWRFINDRAEIAMARLKNVSQEWEKLERRNQESLARLTRKLSALSTLLPLTHDLKADTQSVSEALDTAIKVMDNIEPLITRFQAQENEKSNWVHLIQRVALY